MFYEGCFGGIEDVIGQFQIQATELDGAVIIFAAYTQEDYEGYAEVIFAKDGELYMVTGSHCSCYGLEEQWDPVKVEVGVLDRIFNEGSRFDKFDSTGLKELFRDGASIPKEEFMSYLILMAS